jgi:membrane protein implicated in regulation of membrane protease activity
MTFLSHPAFLFFTNVLDIVNFVVLILLIIALQRMRLEMTQRADTAKRVEQMVGKVLTNTEAAPKDLNGER